MGKSYLYMGKGTIVMGKIESLDMGVIHQFNGYRLTGYLFMGKTYIFMGIRYLLMEKINEVYGNKDTFVMGKITFSGT